MNSHNKELIEQFLGHLRDAEDVLSSVLYPYEEIEEDDDDVVLLDLKYIYMTLHNMLYDAEEMVYDL
jgi:hypothetical protein